MIEGLRRARRYSRERRVRFDGEFGIGTPQANPTVEAEMGILLPRTCTIHVHAADQQRRLARANACESIC